MAFGPSGGYNQDKTPQPFIPLSSSPYPSHSSHVLAILGSDGRSSYPFPQHFVKVLDSLLDRTKDPGYPAGPLK